MPLSDPLLRRQALSDHRARHKGSREAGGSYIED